MKKQGSKRVEIVALDDKHQITTVFAGTLTGDFLPPQLIYQGTTQQCLHDDIVKFHPQLHPKYVDIHDTHKPLKKVEIPHMTNKLRYN